MEINWSEVQINHNQHTRGPSRGAHKLAGLSLNKKKKKKQWELLPSPSFCTSASLSPQFLRLRCWREDLFFLQLSSLTSGESCSLSVMTYGSADALWLVRIRSNRWHSSPSIIPPCVQQPLCPLNASDTAGMVEPHFLGSYLHYCKSTRFNWVVRPIKERLESLCANYDLY